MSECRCGAPDCRWCFPHTYRDHLLWDAFEAAVEAGYEGSFDQWREPLETEEAYDATRI